MTNKPESSNSIVLLVDGLRPSSLGPYGNTWFDTTRLNQLASESILFEQCISDSPFVQLGVRGILQGIHSCCRREQTFSLPSALVDTGGSATLVTSQPEKFSDYSDSFSQLEIVETQTAEKLSDDVSSTQMASFFSQAIQAVQDQERSGLLLLDCPGFIHQWDAPYSYRQALADPEDPVPTDQPVVPSLEFKPAVDDLSLIHI